MIKTKSNNNSKKKPACRPQTKKEVDKPRAKHSHLPPSVIAVTLAAAAVALDNHYTSSADHVATTVSTTARNVSKTVSTNNNNKRGAAAVESLNVTNKHTENFSTIAGSSPAEAAGFAIPNNSLQLNFFTTVQPAFRQQLPDDSWVFPKTYDSNHVNYILQNSSY